MTLSYKFKPASTQARKTTAEADKQATAQIPNASLPST